MASGNDDDVFLQEELRCKNRTTFSFYSSKFDKSYVHNR
jgi:hypothetical protein